MVGDVAGHHHLEDVDLRGPEFNPRFSPFFGLFDDTNRCGSSRRTF